MTDHTLARLSLSPAAPLPGRAPLAIPRPDRGVIGLGVAADLYRASPDKQVLLVSLELCSLAYDHARMDKKDMVALALFADGCAAAVIGAGAGPQLGPEP